MSQRRKLGLTTVRQSVIAVASGALVCWLVLLAFEAARSFPPVVPWSVPITLFVLAVVVVIYALFLPRRREQHSVSSQEAFAALSTSKALIMTGAVFAGGHVVYVMRYIQLFDAPLPSQRVIIGAVTIVASLVLVGAGGLLERACVAKDGDDDPHNSEAGPADPATHPPA